MMFLLALIAIECIVYYNAKNWKHDLKKNKEDDSYLKH